MSSSVTLLHGVGLDRGVWEPVAERLRPRFRVEAMDLPGHGDSPPVAGGTTLADLSAQVAERITSPTHLVGFSLGALIAQHLAIHRPDLVLSLTLVSSVCHRNAAERAAVLSRLETARADVGASTAASLERWFSGSDVDESWVRRTEATLQRNEPDSFLACYEVFATGDAEVWPDLGRIAVPTVAVTGEDDPGSTPDMTRRLAEAIPGCRAVIVPRARHMLPLENPDAIVDCITTAAGGTHV